MSQSNNLLFSEPDDTVASTTFSQWKVLIVDDESSVHDVTKLALSGFEYESRGLEFLHAYSGIEAIEILKAHDDIALALVDVVMEEEHAGLKLVDYIRNTMKNKITRIVLRTGQPGQAPEREVLKKYDINDYKEKTELTSQKLFSTVYTSIRSYRDIAALDANRRGLERVINSSAEIHKTSCLTEFINGVLQQLVAVLYLDEDSVYLSQGALAIEGADGKALVLAGTGKYANCVGKSADCALDNDEKNLIVSSIESKDCTSAGCQHAIYFSPDEGVDDVLLFSTIRELSDDNMHLLRLFCNNVGIAYKNILLNKEIEDTQREILYMLGEAVETRSKETGSHVRRVAEYSRILGAGYGLDEREVNLIMLASPLHDLGKIGIPDSILQKNGKLDDDEWDLMQSHAALGEELLSSSRREAIQAASIIAGQHHEWWDGSGYPRALKGMDIHIYARITSLADVFDALSSKRCYKEAWSLDEVNKYIKAKSGEQFEPKLVELLIEHMDDILRIQQQYPDE